MQQHRGRGAVSRPAGRFEQWDRAPVDDGWQVVAMPGPDPAGHRDDHDLLPRLPTLVKRQSSTRAISRNQSPDIFFNQSVNPYRGCEHGCVYCYARPGHAYEGLSPGLDFETRLFARTDLPALLARELDRPGYRCEPITIGSFTDAYQPIEREYRLTRQLIQVLLERSHPFSIITKNGLITRDLDLLSAAARRHLVACYVSVTTLDRDLARIWEPRASAPHQRLRTIRTLADHGVPVGVIAAPVVPFINDQDFEAILRAGAAAGARSAHYTVLRLPHEVRPVFIDWLTSHFPDRLERVMNRLDDLHGRADGSGGGFHQRMRGVGPWSDLIKSRFRIAASRAGLGTCRPELSTHAFRPAQADGQIDLFDA